MAATLRAQAKAQTRTRLLEAGAEVFAERGFAGASVERIAGRAGHTIGALYSNFAGKDELFLTLMDEHVAHHLADVEEILTAAAPEDRRTAFGRYLVTVAESHRDWGALESEFTRYALAHPELRDRLAQRWRTPRGALARIVCRELPRTADPRAMATVIIALFEGLLIQRRIDADAVPDSLFGDALTWLTAGASTEPPTEHPVDGEDS